MCVCVCVCVCVLSDNRAEFRIQVLAEICHQFGITQIFTVAYHPACNVLVECTNSKTLEVLHPIVGRFLGTWEDWLPQVAATINAIVCESTGQTLHFIIFGSSKRLAYDLLSSPRPPVYAADAYAAIQLNIFVSIHK